MLEVAWVGKLHCELGRHLEQVLEVKGVRTAEGRGCTTLAPQLESTLKSERML